jgi:hypothetical protein
VNRGAGLADMRAAIKKKLEADLPFNDMTLGSVDVFGSREQLEAAGRRLGLKDFHVLRVFGTIQRNRGPLGRSGLKITRIVTGFIQVHCLYKMCAFFLLFVNTL